MFTCEILGLVKFPSIAYEPGPFVYNNVVNGLLSDAISTEPSASVFPKTRDGTVFS